MVGVNIDLGWLGKVVLEDTGVTSEMLTSKDGFKVILMGYTEDGILVYGVKRYGERGSAIHLPTVWNNAILIEL